MCSSDLALSIPVVLYAGADAKSIGWRNQAISLKTPRGDFECNRDVPQLTPDPGPAPGPNAPTCFALNCPVISSPPTDPNIFMKSLCSLYEYFMAKKIESRSERGMYEFSVIGVGVVSVAFFLLILAGLLREMTRHKRRQ